jgi:hypothetical protein
MVVYPAGESKVGARRSLFEIVIPARPTCPPKLEERRRKDEPGIWSLLREIPGSPSKSAVADLDHLKDRTRADPNSGARPGITVVAILSYPPSARQ